MKAELVNPFLEAAGLVFRQMLQMELVRGKTTIKKSPAPGYEVAILIGITGEVTGRVVYSMNMDTVRKGVQKLMPDVSPQDLEKEYKDVIGEIGNMITGNALNVFLKNDKDLDVTVPRVVDLRKQKLDMSDGVTLGLNLYSPIGLVEVNISMDEPSQ